MKNQMVQMDREYFNRKFSTVAPLGSPLHKRLVAAIFEDNPKYTLEEAERRIASLEHKLHILTLKMRVR